MGVGLFRQTLRTLGAARVATGSYAGNDAANRVFNTGLDKVKLVELIVLEQGGDWAGYTRVFKTDTMSGNTSGHVTGKNDANVDGETDDASAQISISGGSFTVVSADLNFVGLDVHWIAWGE